MSEVVLQSEDPSAGPAGEADTPAYLPRQQKMVK